MNTIHLSQIVHFEHKGLPWTGRVVKAGRYPSVVYDKGTRLLVAERDFFTPGDDFSAAVDDSTMNDWSVLRYKTRKNKKTEYQIVDAILCYKRKRVLHLSNEGLGQPSDIRVLDGVDPRYLQLFWAAIDVWKTRIERAHIKTCVAADAWAFYAYFVRIGGTPATEVACRFLS